MTDMVEKVARAIRENFPHQYAGMAGRPIWEDMGPESRDPWMKMARAAIRALMEPTEEMVEAGRFRDGVTPGHESFQEIMIQDYQAMLKAALDD